jgi:hypothetical protein
MGPTLIRWARMRIGAAHGRVVAVGVLRAIPRRIVDWITVTETVTEVEAKECAADTEYGAAPESTKLPIEARIEAPTREGTPGAEACAREPMASTEVAPAAPMPAAFVTACDHGVLRKPDDERCGSCEIP